MAQKLESAGEKEIKFTIKKSADEKYSYIDEVISLSVTNAEFYKADKSFIGIRLHANFERIVRFLNSLVPVIKEIEGFASIYDFDENTPGNGYRSFVYIFDCAIEHTNKTCNYIAVNRGNLLFRKGIYMKEIEACSQILQSILQICENLIKMHKNSSDGNLYSKEYSHDNLITRNAKVISQVGFYGRAIGFQYCDSMKPILRFLAVSMASFSEQYFSNGNKLLRSTNSLFAHSKYFLDPENCAQRIVNISHNADINFCKSYWFLAEGKLMHSLPGIVGYKVDVNKVFKIPPEPLQIYSEKHNKNIDIPLPTSHIGLGSVSCRLLSAKRRQGMVGEKSFSENSLEPSKYLIIHSHGGGWVAQSSKSHEFYLREWAVKMDIPILSIDYSLAPEAPFPRGLEEVFYTYCWILKNVELLGSTGEHIVFAGDSAGGNLNTACIVKCIDMGIRTPKGIFNAYSPFLVNFASTPARFLSFVDPLLPYGFIMRVFKSYGASKADENIQNVPLSKNNKIHHELVEEVRDDNQDENALISSDSSKTLEAMWQKIKNNTEENEWQTNLGSIRETPSEEPTSPFLFPQVENDDDDALEMKISSRPQEQKKDETMSGFLEKVEHATIEESKPRDRIGSRTLSEDNIVIDALSLQNFQERFQKATSTFVNAITTPFKPANENSLKTIPKLQNNLIPQAPDDEFVFTVPKNPYLSPYLASDDILKQFPPTRILTTIVDPCLDDCVEFSKKLRNLNVDIKLDIVEGVNHGFLNFAQVSRESHRGSMMCMRSIAELLGLTLQKFTRKPEVEVD